MNIFLWTLQALLALHTLIGAVWKFKNTAEQTMPSLQAIPEGMWHLLAIFEIICALGLILPAFYAPVSKLVPVSAICIAVVMLVFCGLHLASGATAFGPMIYWLVVAAICAFIAYGRFVLQPFN
jgi:hypothetical protein